MSRAIFYFAVILYMSINCAQPLEFDKDLSWDYLIFTQSWPDTVCLKWKARNPDHKCNFPKQQDAWTIHGIWPTKIGTKGPFNCNTTWHFDPEIVKPIESDLEQVWTNVEADTQLYDLWAHEWNKHGTCSASIKPLDSQIKYFQTGINLHNILSMTDMLAKADIYPSEIKEYQVIDFHNAIVSQLQVVPDIQCDHEKGKQYIVELRVCMSKALKLINCVSSSSARIVTNCNSNQPIYYHKPDKPLVEVYKFIKLLQWFSF